MHDLKWYQNMNEHPMKGTFATDIEAKISTAKNLDIYFNGTKNVEQVKHVTRGKTYRIMRAHMHYDNADLEFINDDGHITSLASYFFVEPDATGDNNAGINPATKAQPSQTPYKHTLVLDTFKPDTIIKTHELFERLNEIMQNGLPSQAALLALTAMCNNDMPGNYDYINLAMCIIQFMPDVDEPKFSMYDYIDAVANANQPVNLDKLLQLTPNDFQTAMLWLATDKRETYEDREHQQESLELDIFE